MTHDAHFLARLERLEREHAELALGLYYDSALVRHILGVADIPDDAERVALCLGTPEVGPHVIVARDGHFVTCLGEGMQLRADQPIISRHKLDSISGEVEALRALVADAAAGGSRQRRRKLERVFEAGPGLSQEEFEDLGSWLPLMAADFLSLHVETVVRTLDLVDRLARVKKFNKRYDEALHDLWRLSWAVAHLGLLLGSDGGGRMRKLFEVVEADMPGLSMQIGWGMIRSGVAPFALRGAWFTSKLPSLVMPTAKRRYLDEQASFLTTLTDGLTLAAVGLRHRKYQGEVRKVLARGDPSLEGGIDHVEMVRAVCARYFESYVEDKQPQLRTLVEASRDFVRGLYPEADEAQLAALDQVPEDVAVATMMLAPSPIEHSTESVCGVLARLSWVIGIEAKTFYLPETFVAMARMPYSRETGLLLLEPRKQLGVARPAPIVKPPKIGRNQPCPCGSGAKYKRCCGAPG
ncbi:MAG: SEC-C metal-binding domain-containing protein [Enhygromyxa sp.]